MLSAAFFLAQWIQALRASSDGFTTVSGARSSLIAISVVMLVGLAFRGAVLWSPRWLSWIAIAATLTFAIIAGFLFALDQLETAFAVYGGLQVLRAEMLFSDTYWILAWFDCDFCDRWAVNYGSTVALLDPLTFGLIGASWLMPIGIGMTMLSAAAIWLLARQSSSLGRWIVVLAALSPAWLLSIDRANSDSIIFFVCVIGLWFVARSPSLISWGLFAGGLWILGTIKFFPFAMGMTLLFALWVRRGWTVVAGFLVASGAYMAIAWDSYANSSEWTTRSDLLVGDFPYYARIFLSDQLAGLASDAVVEVGVWIGLTALVILGALLGWGSYRHDSSGRRDGLYVATIAMAGGAAFVGKVLWAGFGFMYTGIFLIMIAPALALSLNTKDRCRNGVILAVALLSLLAVFSAYNTALATTTALVVAGFGIGISGRVLLDPWSTQRGATRECVSIDLVTAPGHNLQSRP